MTKAKKTTAVSLSFLAIVVAIAAIGVLLAERSVKSNLEDHALASARQWADTFLVKGDLIEPILAQEPLTQEAIDYFERIGDAGQIFKFKVLDKTGRLLLVSDELERTGHFPPEFYRPDIVERLRSDERTVSGSIFQNKPGRPDVYFSAYVPFVRDGRLEAVVETYVDLTDQYSVLKAKSYQNVAILALIVVLVLAHGMYTLFLLHRQRVATRTIYELSRRDPLTGLANRAEFAEALVRCVEVTRTRTSVALYMVDLDGFKLVNDSLGHDAGDRVLCKVARALEDAAPEGSLVARLGGDEFAVLEFKVAAEAQLRRNARALVAAIDAIDSAYGAPIDISASVGVSSIGAPEDVERLQKTADTALYRAKHLGKNRFVLYGDASAEAPVTDAAA